MPASFSPAGIIDSRDHCEAQFLSRVKRILFVITDLDVGGVPLHLLRLAKFLQSRGWCVHVASLKDGGPVADHLREAGIAVHSCGASHPLDWRVFENLARLLESLRPDLVHSFLFHANLASRLACQLSGFGSERLICEIQTVEIERRWHLWMDRLTHRFCKKMICNSASVMQHLHHRAGISLDHLMVISGGVDVDAVTRAKPVSIEQWKTQADECLILWVGRMDPIKGLDTLVDAVGLVKRERDVKLLLVGDGPERRLLESCVARCGLESTVHFLGRRDDVFGLVRLADLFVFPSRTEGMPNALLEAMAGRLPVITTDVPGCRDLVADGETGRVVRVDDAGALASAIVAAIENPEATQEMSATAWHYVKDHHGIEQCHQAYENFYSQILGSSS